jgi:hypothetical protein
MKTWIFFFILLSAAVAGIAALNWAAISMPVRLSLGAAEIKAPLGWILLGPLAVVSVFFLLWIVALQFSAIRRAHKQARDLEESYALAAEAESFRFTELRQFVTTELKNQSDRIEAYNQELLAKLDGIRQDLRTDIQESGNALAAHFGELEDELKHPPHRDHPNRLSPR